MGTVSLPPTTRYVTATSAALLYAYTGLPTAPSAVAFCDHIRIARWHNKLGDALPSAQCFSVAIMLWFRYKSVNSLLWHSQKSALRSAIGGFHLPFDCAAPIQKSGGAVLEGEHYGTTKSSRTSSTCSTCPAGMIGGSKLHTMSVPPHTPLSIQALDASPLA
jgi:hypothetical protein